MQVLTVFRTTTQHLAFTTYFFSPCTYLLHTFSTRSRTHAPQPFSTAVKSQGRVPRGLSMRGPRPALNGLTIWTSRFKCSTPQLHCRRALAGTVRTSTARPDIRFGESRLRTALHQRCWASSTALYSNVAYSICNQHAATKLGKCLSFVRQRRRDARPINSAYPHRHDAFLSTSSEGRKADHSWADSYCSLPTITRAGTKEAPSHNAIVSHQ